jgi:hypothetical protein
MSRRRHHDEADEPEGAEGLSGRPVRHSYRADPSAAAPELEPRYLDLLTSSAQRRMTMGTGDMRPPVMRPGCMSSMQHPSRRGERLYYPDGRVTLLDGTPLQPATQGERMAAAPHGKRRGKVAA